MRDYTDRVSENERWGLVDMEGLWLVSIVFMVLYLDGQMIFHIYFFSLIIGMMTVENFIFGRLIDKKQP